MNRLHHLKAAIKLKLTNKFISNMFRQSKNDFSRIIAILVVWFWMCCSLCDFTFKYISFFLIIGHHQLKPITYCHFFFPSSFSFYSLADVTKFDFQTLSKVFAVPQCLHYNRDCLFTPICVGISCFIFFVV